MKAKSIIINILTPCHEDWQTMTTVEKGRHCDVCEKTVTDFTQMSNAQILTFYQKNDKKICGRFHQSQLNTPISMRTEMRFPLPVIVAATALMALSACGTESKTTAPLGETIAIVTNNNLDSIYETPILVGDVMFTHYPLSGTVIDALRNMPIKEATIILVGADGQVKTDEEGNFRITLSESCHAKDTLHLQISAPHYETKDIFIPSNVDFNQKIELSPIFLKGKMKVSEIPKPKTSF